MYQYQDGRGKKHIASINFDSANGLALIRSGETLESLAEFAAMKMHEHRMGLVDSTKLKIRYFLPGNREGAPQFVSCELW